MLGLKWEDVDLAGGVLTVKRALNRVRYRHGCGVTCGRKRAAECPQRVDGGGLVLDTPKTRAGRRTIPLPAEVVSALIRHIAEQEAERAAALDLWHNTDLVLTTVVGEPIDPTRHGRDWNALLERAGVERARLHDARHSAATALLAMGVDATTVMGIMGWSQRALLDRYGHPVEEMKRAAAERMSAAM